MDIIQNTNDLVQVALAFSILLLAVFLAWLIFYFVMIAREFFVIIRGLHTRVKKVDEAIDAFREKIEHSTSYLMLIGEGMKKLVELVKESGFMKKSNYEDIPERIIKTAKKIKKSVK